MVEQIISRWQHLLDQFEEAPKAILAKELLKVMPAKPDFEADWRINEHYDEQRDIYCFNFTIIVRPIYSASDIESVDLSDYFSQLIARSSAEDLAHLANNIASMPQEMELPYKLDHYLIPCLNVGSETGVIIFRITGKPYEQMDEIENQAAL